MNRKLVFICLVITITFAPCAVTAQPQSIGSFQNAVAVSVNPASGDIFVIDEATSKLYRFDRDGKAIAVIGGSGIENENLNAPSGLTASDGINLYIADRGNQRIVRYDRYLNFISSFSSLASSASGNVSPTLPQTIRPLGVAVSAQGDLFILEESLRQVIKLNPFDPAQRSAIVSGGASGGTGNALLTFGGFDAGKGRLEEPVQIEVSAGGTVFIADEKLSCVIAFDQFGNFITRIGEGVFGRPKSLATGMVTFTLTNGEKQSRECLLVADEKNIFVVGAAAATGHAVLKKIPLAALELSRPQPAAALNLTGLALTRTDLLLLTKTTLYKLPLSQTGIDAL